MERTNRSSKKDIKSEEDTRCFFQRLSGNRLKEDILGVVEEYIIQHRPTFMRKGGATTDHVLERIGSLLGQEWNMFGSGVEQLWTKFVKCLERVWIKHGPSLDHVWNTFGSNVAHVGAKFG